MRLGWRLGYLDEHYHSPLLVYSAICYLRGIAHYFSEVHYIYACLSWIWILSYGKWVSSRGFIWEMVKHWLSPLLCWLSLGDGFILAIFLGLGMVYEFDLLVRDLHPWLFIWFRCCWDFLVGVLWRISYLHSLHLEVCVEGHDTGYDLHEFS